MKRVEKIPSKYRKEIASDLSALGKTIQAKRDALGYTQESIAEKLDIGVSTIKHIEQGIRFPSLPLLFFICRILEIEIKIK
jgi:transcriptional regulator with XRE-family HTH domain